MAARFDLVRDVNVGSEHKNCKLKVRVIKLWKLPIFNDKHQKPMLEMVVMDEQCDRIQCTIRNQHVRFFEDELFEGKVFMISNFDVALNSLKFKSTRHEFRIFFKKETQIKQVEDSMIPINGFNFVPNSVILSEQREDSHLVDVIGLLTGKGDLIEYTKNDKQCNYIVIELDDLEGKEKLRCTLWEDFAIQFITHLKEQPAPEYIVILQFAKMKFYKGMMGVFNTNYTSKLLINADIPEVRQFRQRLLEFESPSGTQVTQIDREAAYSMEEDFLNQNVYKPICELKEVNEIDKQVFVTYGTVKDIENGHNWWYKGCKKCFQSLKDRARSFYCTKYSIHLRVVDETGSASFILYDREAVKFLKISCSDLRAAYVSRGGDKNKYPEEIDAFKDKKLLFKVSVKIEDLNSFQPCVITILKLCPDEAIISAFIEKYKIDDFSFIPENSELLSHPADCSDLNKDSWSQSCETPADLGEASFLTPSKPMSDEKWVAEPSDQFADDFNQSSTKLRKVVKDHHD